MKRISLIVMAIIVIFMANALVRSQVPTKLFDVRAGNGIVDNGTAQAQATYIAYKDAAAKQKVLDAFASAYGYQDKIPNPLAGQQGQAATIPNPQSKQAFFNQQLTRYIKDIVRSQDIATAQKTAADSAAATVDATLPPQ